MFDLFGMHDLMNCVTSEMAIRPVPHVFEAAETAALEALFLQEAPKLYQFMLPQLRPPVQTLTKVSRLGWPFFAIPGDKKKTLAPYFQTLSNDGVSCLKGCFTIMNVRLQAEPVSKLRDFLFVDGNGDVEARTVDRRLFKIKTPAGERVPSRVRLVFNLPFANLYKQVLDSAVINWLLQWPVFHHDLYTPGGTLRVGPNHLCFDVKHFERHTAAVCRARASLIGGLYAEIGDVFANANPFLCPSTLRRKSFFLRVAREKGFSDQFASGDSAVSPAQKEVMFCLYRRFATTHLRVPETEATLWVLNGGDERLTIRNAGDDNSVDAADPATTAALLSFLQTYIKAEPEEPPKFLGFTYSLERARWELPVPSYLHKSWLNERQPGSNFRKHPFYGQVKKREIYTRHGHPDLAEKVFPAEDQVLADLGLPWIKVLELARKEEVLLSQAGTPVNYDFILGKDYMMTPDEKLATGLFQGYSIAETAPMLNRLLGDEWKQRRPNV